MSMSKARARYAWHLLLAGALYTVALTVAIFVIKRGYVDGPAAYAVAILPALGIIGIIAAKGRYLAEEQDEYVRMLATQQMLWATGIALSAATIWGFLEAFHLAPHVEPYLLAVVWFGADGVAGCLRARLNRDRAGA